MNIVGAILIIIAINGTDAISSSETLISKREFPYSGFNPMKACEKVAEGINKRRLHNQWSRRTEIEAWCEPVIAD